MLGPTEDRIALFLERATRNGRVTLRSAELVERLGVARSELYRVTRRLRILGLFGIEDDRGGTRAGRRYWRTAVEHDGPGLDPVKHRTAWARVVAYVRTIAGRAAPVPRPAAYAHGRPVSDHALAGAGPGHPVDVPAGLGPPLRSLAEAMRALAPELARAWRL